MRPPTLLILTAVILEARALADALEMTCPAPDRLSKAGRKGITITLGITGISATQLPGEAADCVIMAGLAGALDPSLAIGDLVVDDWPEQMAPPAGSKRGAIHASPRIAADPAEKARLFAHTEARAVDMESAAVRAWAGRQGAAFGAIRAISDRADQALDPAVLTMVDAWGRPRPATIGRALLRHPRLIPQLVRLGVDSKRAARRLGQALREVVDALASGPVPPYAERE